MSSLPLLRFYDIKNGSLTFYGKDPTPAFPVISPKDMHAPDGLKLLFNECTHLLEILDEDVLRENATLNEKFILTYFISKVYSSICTSLLILEGVMKPNINDRVKIFADIYEKKFPEIKKKIPNLPGKIKGFVEIRRDAKFSPALKNPTNAFFELQKDMEVIFRYYLKRMIGVPHNALWNHIYYEINRKMWKVYYSPYIEFMFKKKTGFPLPKPISSVLSYFAKYHLNSKFREHSEGLTYNFRFPREVCDRGLGIISLMLIVFFSKERRGYNK